MQTQTTPHSHTDLPPLPDVPKPLVVDKDSPVIGRQIARLIVAAAINEPDSPAELDGLVNVLLKNGDLCASHDEFMKGVVRGLYALASDDPSNALLQDWYKRALDNIEVTRECERAYWWGDRTNPDAVWFPGPDNRNNNGSIHEQLPWVKRIPIVGRDTKVSSAGSCFAAEIAARLQREDFQYVIKEPCLNIETGLDAAGARWGTIYNAPCMRQLIERSFGLRKMPPLVWIDDKVEGGPVWRDPWRTGLTYTSAEEYQESWRTHLEASREVFLDVDVFVMTLGLNEIWEMRTDGTVFSQAPWRLSPALVRNRVLTVDENVEALEGMWTAWKKFNPKVELILSVSPVPMYATFRADEQHVVTATCSAKATLRLATEEFAKRHDDVHYFPSYETVMYCSKNQWEDDNYHVSQEAIGRAMDLFDLIFVKDEAKGRTAS